MEDGRVELGGSAGRDRETATAARRGATTLGSTAFGSLAGLDAACRLAFSVHWSVAVSSDSSGGFALDADSRTVWL